MEARVGPENLTHPGSGLPTMACWTAFRCCCSTCRRSGGHPADRPLHVGAADACASAGITTIHRRSGASNM
eukprot:4414198-Alexandrium_andersonii.AAC.1